MHYQWDTLLSTTLADTFAWGRHTYEAEVFISDCVYYSSKWLNKVRKTIRCLSKCDTAVLHDVVDFVFTIITGRNAGIKITFVSLFLVPSPRRGDSVHRLSSNLAGKRRPPTSYSLPKLKIFGGHLGNYGPKNLKKRLN